MGTAVEGMKSAALKSGVGGYAIGYTQDSWRSEDRPLGKSHGVHVDLSLVHKKINVPLLYPALTFQTNLSAPGAALTVGMGPSLHIGVPGIAQVYGNIMVNGHLASIDNDNYAGWSATTTAGAQILFLYGEMIFPVSGSAFRQAGQFTTGLRLGF